MSQEHGPTIRTGRLREQGRTAEDAIRNAISLLEQRSACRAADSLRDAIADIGELADAAAAYRTAVLAAYRFPLTLKPGKSSHEYVALLEARDAAESRLLAALANMNPEV